MMYELKRVDTLGKPSLKKKKKAEKIFTGGGGGGAE